MNQLTKEVDQLTDPRDTASSDFLNKFGKISGHSLVFFTGYVFTSVVGYFFMVYMARRLGSHALGIFSLGMSLVTLCTLLSTMGLPGAAQRYIPLYSGRGESREIPTFVLSSIVLILSLSVILGGVFFWGRSWIAETVFNENSLTAYLAIFGALIPVSALSMFLMAVLTGYQKVASRTIIDSYLRNPLKIVISIGLITIGLGLTGWIIGEIAAGIISIMLAAALVLKLIASKRFDLRISQIRFKGEVLTFAATMLGIGILAYTWQHVSKIILGVYLNAEQIGVYSAALIIGAFIPSFLLAANSIFAPIVAELQGFGEKSELTRLFQVVTKWVIGFTWPFAIVIILLSRMMMGIYGEEFTRGWTVLVVLAIGELVNVGVGSVGILLIMSGHQRFELVSGSLAASISILLSIVLIPKMGILGAAIATSIGVASANLMRLIMVYRIMHIIPYNRSFIKLFLPIFFSSVIVFVYSRVFIAASWPVWISIPVALMVSYFSYFIVFFIQGLDSNERLILEALGTRLRQQ